MAEDETPTMMDWEDLPLKVRRNRKHMYNYLKSVLFPEDEDKQGTLFFLYGGGICDLDRTNRHMDQH